MRERHARSNSTVDACTNSTCIFEYADAYDDDLPFACLNADELRSFELGVGRVVNWAVQQMTKQKCAMEGGIVYAGCVTLADAQSMVLCMYGDSVRFLFEG